MERGNRESHGLLSVRYSRIPDGKNPEDTNSVHLQIGDAQETNQTGPRGNQDSENVDAINENQESVPQGNQNEDRTDPSSNLNRPIESPRPGIEYTIFQVVQKSLLLQFCV